MNRTRPRLRRGLSQRVLGLALAAMLVTEGLLFVPALTQARQDWLERHIVAAQLAMQALPQLPPGVPGAGVPRRTREELLRLADVVTARLQEPGRPLVELSANGPVQAGGLLDLRREGALTRIWRSLAALTGSGRRMLLVMASSPKRPNAVVSVVLREADLDAFLRGQAARIALSGLLIAGVTGLLLYLALLHMLVRPMRRIVGSIAAFRADPERCAPMQAPEGAEADRDEMTMAAHELAAMQRELRAALWRNARLAALGTAMAKVSHDLRGVLSPALLAAERLQNHAEPAVRSAGEVVARTVDRAAGLVRSTLEFVRDGPAPAERLRVELRSLAEEAADQARAVNRAIRLQNELPAGLVVEADPQGLARALGNLMRNSAQAGATRLRLAMTDIEEERLAVAVEDDGPGLPEALRATLFRPFVSGGRSGGSGLGLAITRDMMRAQGGEVLMARSDAGGTLFHVVLPPQPLGTAGRGGAVAAATPGAV